VSTRLVLCGAGGMLARDVALAAGRRGVALDALDRAELDITNREALHSTLAERRPSAVVNCAAYTDVDGAEAEADAATTVNGTAAGELAAAAAAVGATVVFPSTDYVFDGDKTSPYVESDEPNPLSSYGRSKLAGERATAAANPRHLIVRTSWLYGVGGRNFVETMLALGSERDEVTVVADQVGCPTYTAHLAEAILELLLGGRSGVYHAAGSGSCSWHGFASRIFEAAGVACRALPGRTAELGRPAPRPAHSVLVSEREDAVRLPDWQAALDEYLAERAVRA
jgi:dTDP-4-dehydrorhamnose reductase